MIHKVDEGYVISAYNSWLPGVYDSERAAKYAFRFDNEDLDKLQKFKNRTTKTISFEDLQELRVIKQFTIDKEESNKPFEIKIKKENQLYAWTENGKKPIF